MKLTCSTRDLTTESHSQSHHLPLEMEGCVEPQHSKVEP